MRHSWVLWIVDASQHPSQQTHESRLAQAGQLPGLGHGQRRPRDHPGGGRHLLPDHHSTAALDAHLGTVRDFLDSRSFAPRNARRTTTMLGLVRLHLNGVDNARRYSELLRSCLDAKGGVAPGQRVRYDTGASVRYPEPSGSPYPCGTDLSHRNRRRGAPLPIAVAWKCESAVAPRTVSGPRPESRKAAE